MSDTPRTDALRDSSDHPTPRGELWQFACDLERELASCNEALAAARAENVECLQAWRKANEKYYFAAKERDAARAELERAMRVVEAAEAAMCIEFPKSLRDAMQRWWDEGAGR